MLIFHPKTMWQAETVTPARIKLCSIEVLPCIGCRPPKCKHRLSLPCSALPSPVPSPQRAVP
ncbi:hypothetical protein C8Q74DRAFT_1280694 [Fomes fomentarius]|nr:hypothetical protein C8Q74DRAFT_1280694 [Fomes fomentarius]